MSIEATENVFREKVSSQLRLVSEGTGRYRILTPFVFDDGDHLAIVLKKEGDSWILSDEGHTYMHLTYDLDEKDLQHGTRQKIISNALSAFRVEDREGELLTKIDDGIRDALHNFVQALRAIQLLFKLSEAEALIKTGEEWKSLDDLKKALEV